MRPAVLMPRTVLPTLDRAMRERERAKRRSVAPLAGRLFVAAVLLVLPFGSEAAVAKAAGGSTTASIRAGPGLTITGPGLATFVVTASERDHVVRSTLGTVTARDTTGTGHGFHITLQASPLRCVPSTGACPHDGDATLPAGSLLIDVPTVRCAVGTSCVGAAAPPVVVLREVTALDTGEAVTVASAAPRSGMGTYEITSGPVPSGTLAAVVPGSAVTGTYTTTLAASIISGP